MVIRLPVLLLLTTVVVGCGVTAPLAIAPGTRQPAPPVTAPPRPQTPLPTVIANRTPTTAAPCHYRFAANGAFLPDLSCTPGEAEPDLDDSNAQSTFCQPDWMDDHRPRPSTNITNRLKYQSIVDYGWAPDLQTAQRLAGAFEEDHLEAREIGGLSDVHLGANGRPTNLWAEPDFHAKDAVENAAHRAVCDGAMTLDHAQRQMAADWTVLGSELGVH